jgi:hypothetical protein
MFALICCRGNSLKQAGNKFWQCAPVARLKVRQPGCRLPAQVPVPETKAAVQKVGTAPFYIFFTCTLYGAFSDNQFSGAPIFLFRQPLWRVVP